ncbi:mannose-6-phosphate isomerase [Canicola haemoglobinophilus]|uniref:mannose-6-phosphate isomerase n=1 Tax=Canicola haemoglobinophilus TaxID=733 RepID=A0AB38H6W9_9PAST|nr:mannose-6-phosphate isomerase, class I [Canicola haemoglobinophilus]STO55528.1 mannose-6-phosphate isomerase [Canicola haemoglobinophilus]STO67855.1 mannose-6-phosphate isomerase [Canicola haemoglobinophilus]
MHSIYQLQGQLQHYVWGGQDFIPELLNIEKQQNQYYAEWWLGAHSSAPSVLNIAGKSVPLTDFLAENPQVLGKTSLANFGQELPYLLKILDVAKPLSIQLHPTKQQAEIGFEQENQAGISLKDPKRTYKDRNHKPEMMIALSDFWLLHGFKQKAEIIATLKTCPSLTALAQQLESQDLHSFYAQIMQADQNQLSTWLAPIIAQNQAAYKQGQLELDNPDYWVLYTIDAMEIAADKLDAGLICFYLFNIVHLNGGEGIYQDAGIPHAYLRGQNIELMAGSDNVIRGGLTPKHVDINELLKIVDCSEITPRIIPVAPQEQDIFTYSTPAKDFAMSNVRYRAQQKQTLTANNAEILLVMQGTVKITANQTALELKQGESAFICADVTYQIEGLAEGYAVIAKLP